MSYGGQSNAPWQRNIMQGHPQAGGFHQGSQMFMQNAPQNNMAAFGHGGMQGGGGNMFPGGGGGNSVSYPQHRTGLNPVAFQQGGGSESQYNSIGTVTKISYDWGLVNNEVFFHQNVCKGPEPKMGDRVMFEATYANNEHFNWKATRIQVIPPLFVSSNKDGYNSVPPPNEYQRGQMRRNSPKRSPVRGRTDRDHRDRERLHRSRDRDEDEHDRKRRREDRSRDRRVGSSNRIGAAANEGRGAHSTRNEKEKDNRGESRKKERDAANREREDREREKERAHDLELQRAGGAKGRRARTIKRYMVQIPKYLLTIKSADIQDLRQRYSTLYIPSDFFHAKIKWPDSFTLDNPFSLRRPCQFHIMHEVVESPTEQNLDLLEPADANYLYSAKVMLMSLAPIAEIYKKSIMLLHNQAVHPSRLINFLVGVKGRTGSMAIGGPWSPSLDGENPDEDPSVLIRTAIRTCKALTGVDLSNCTQWYRFVELYYHRTEYKNMEKDGPPRVETVVIYLPDVHSCMPSIEEWQTLTQVYKDAADELIARRSALVAAAAANANDENAQADDAEMADNTEMADDGADGADRDEGDEGDENKPTDNDENMAENNEDNDVDGEAEAECNEEGEDGDGEPQDDYDEEEEQEHEQEDKMNDSTASAGTGSGAPNDDSDVMVVDADKEDPADEELPALDENDEPAPEPTHYSLLDLKTMKVQEIRDELLARNLPDKGVRNVIMARLAKALNTEKAEETRNKSRNKNKQHSMAKKFNPIRKANDTEEKMELDTDKTAVDESKKKKISAKRHASKGQSEKEEDWASGMIDFESSDIVILDEYDSSKNVEETNVKEMSEKEKALLIRRHTLPPAPHIIVHPNRLAKGGKFDCAVVSLSLLLDYHPDDSKERFFEVSLFAELFNDMLMRDFAFNIYKEIYLYEDTAANTANTTGEQLSEVKSEGDVEKEKVDEIKKEKEKDKEKDKEGEKEKEKEKKEKTSKKEASKTSSEDKSNKEHHHNDDTQSIKSESRKRKLSTSTSVVNGREHELSVSDQKKMVVVKPQLLLSFVYFDTTHCGYIFEKDLEDLFTVLGLNLSRSQIKKVLGKLATRQAIYYRKLTDREELPEATPAIEDVDDLPMDELKRIAAGNNHYEFVFSRNSAQNHLSALGGDEDTKEGLMNFNGTVVHVGKLLNQINRTEKNYSDLEKLYSDLLKQHTDLQKQHNKSTAKIKDLQAEMKTVSRKLTDANQDYYSLNRKFRDQNATLSYIYSRVMPYFVREKDKEKDIKAEGSREKDKDEKEKEKNKEGSEKEKAKEDKEKEKTKEDKDKEKEKEKTKEDKEKEKDKPKEDKDKEKSKEDKEKETKNAADNSKEKEKVKDESEKKLVKDDKEKTKDDKEKEKTKDDKEKEKTKDDKEKNKVNNEKEQPKVVVKAKEIPPKEDKTKEKEKPVAKDDKVKPTPQKNLAEKPKLQTPKVQTPKPQTANAKKLADSKPAGKIMKKADTVAKK